MEAGAEGGRDALCLAHPVRVHHQCAAAAEEQHDGPEQVPEHLCRPGEGHSGKVCQQFPPGVPCVDGCAPNAAPRPDKNILGREAQRIQRFTDRGYDRVAGKLPAQVAHMALGLTAQPVPVQKPDALQLCPKGAKLLSALGF